MNLLDQASGLPDLANEWIYADSKGGIWISSNAGLVFFDGNKTQVFKHIEGDSLSLPDNNIQSDFFEDAEGNIWFSTYASLVCYIRKHNHFQRIPLPVELGQNGFHIAFDDPNLGLALSVDRKKLYFFDRQNRTVNLQDNIPLNGETRLSPIYNDLKQLTAIAGFCHNLPGLQLYRFAGRQLVSVEHHFSGQRPGEPTLNPLSITIQDTSVWIAADEGLFSFNPQTGKWQKYSSGNTRFLDVAVWKEKFLLASYRAGGLCAFDLKSGQWIQSVFQTNGKTGFDSNPVQKINIDQYGTVWLSMFSQGISFCRPDKIKFNQIMVQAGGRPDNTFVPEVLAKDERGNAWCLTKNSTLYFSPAPVPPHTQWSFQKRSYTGLNTKIFYLLPGKKDEMWALCFDGLYRSTRASLHFTKIADGFFLHGIHLADGRLLFSADEQGLLIWDGKTLSKVSLDTSADETSLSFPMLFQDAQGFVYASEGLQDIWVISPKERFKVHKIIPFNADVHRFHPAASPNPGIWVCGSAGLAFLDTRKLDIQPINVQDGLTQPHVYSILQDSTGKLWLGTDRGLISYHPVNQNTARYGLFDGLLSLNLSGQAFIEYAPDQYWMGSQYGFNYFNPYAVIADTLKPKVFLSTLLVNDKPQKPVCQETGSTNIAAVKAIRLSRNERTVSFDVAVLDYGDPAQTRFRYRMLPEEAEWVNAQAGERIRYPNLAAGKHTLEVVGINSEGVASEPIYLRITVGKKLLEHWLFYVVAAIFIGMAGYWISRYRSRQLLREARLRNRISADLHDDIGAALSNMGILNTLVRQRVDPNSEVVTFLDRIDEEVNHSAEALDDIIWSINPQNDPLDLVLARIRRFTSEVFEAKDIAGSISLPPNMQGLKLGMERRRAFYLFAKEAIHNMAKYAFCTQASVQIAYENGLLTFTVSDNGVGFDVENARSAGNGLKTMADRAQALNGKMSLQSEPGEGTVVSLSFPLTENGD
ncbi:MAG: two-component regulator propeller domain-containing protein [Saprospiraceae bacterium]|nr:two-component regulator propeller domain-containing protein [Saprospiraceae bacterium]